MLLAASVSSHDGRALHFGRTNETFFPPQVRHEYVDAEDADVVFAKKSTFAALHVDSIKYNRIEQQFQLHVVQLLPTVPRVSKSAPGGPVR